MEITERELIPIYPNTNLSDFIDKLRNFESKHIIRSRIEVAKTYLGPDLVLLVGTRVATPTEIAEYEAQDLFDDNGELGYFD